MYVCCRRRRICRRYFWYTLHKSQIPSTRLLCYEYILYIPIFFFFYVLIYISASAIDETRKEIEYESHVWCSFDSPVELKFLILIYIFLDKLDLKQSKSKSKKKRRLLLSIWYSISGFNICPKKHRPYWKKTSNYIHIFLRRF